MTILQFQLLNENEQEEFVHKEGVFLGNYVSGDKTCDFYRLLTFYVKVCYSLGAQDKGIITTFVDPGNLPF